MKSHFTLLDELDWYDHVHAKKIKELYPEVNSIHIRLKRDWCSPDVSDYVFVPEDPIPFSIDCLNPDCTGKYILTSLLEQAIRDRQRKEGIVYCEGKESSKPGALSCSGRLEYFIEPKMK